VRPEPEDAHARRVADLESAAASAKENADALTTRLADLASRRAKTASDAAGLAAAAAVSDHVRAVLHPRAGFEVSLYVHLTHMHWNDMDAAVRGAARAAAEPGADPAAPVIPPPDPGRVRATIADPQVIRKPGGGGGGSGGGSGRGSGGGYGGGGGGGGGLPEMAPPRHDMHPVDLDTRGLSAVEVADRLWALIEEKTL
jgi:hypothetical protein